VTLFRDPSYLLTLAFAQFRMDTWVLRVSIAIPLLCLAGLGLWQLAAWLGRKWSRKPRTVRESPEPPLSSLFPQRSASGKPEAPARGTAPTPDDPERLQQLCQTLEDSLAEKYRELAEAWLRSSQPRKAVAALQKVLQICPDGPQAALARDRLEQIGREVEDHS
jgi:hypothetical protein